jgi:hypothetical protein
MNRIISERHLVVVLFVLVFITFSFAHEDSKQLEQIYSGLKPLPGVELTASQITGRLLHKK